MMDDTPGTTLANGHLQSIQDQARAQVRGHGPTNHSAAPGIYDDSQIQPTCPGGDIGDIPLTDYSL